MRHFAPSPTVRSSSVPFYMMGFPSPHHLGQDDGSGDGTIDTWMYDPGNDLVPPTENIPILSVPFLPQPSDLNIDPTTYDPSGGLVAPGSLDPQTAAIAQMYSGAVAAGTMTAAQAAAAIAASAAGVAKSATGLRTAPSPRVSSRPPGAGSSLLTSQNIIKGVPDIAVLGIAAVLAFAAMGR